jgi:hypothetical protein
VVVVQAGCKHFAIAAAFVVVVVVGTAVVIAVAAMATVVAAVAPTSAAWLWWGWAVEGGRQGRHDQLQEAVHQGLHADVVHLWAKDRRERAPGWGK